VVQNVVAVRQRATATALLFVCLNVLALGLGALFTGFVIDRLAQGEFVHASAPLRAGLVLAASFQEACPGGAAPGGAVPALAELCQGVLVRASHQGLSLTVGLYLWAALHYVLGAAGLEGQLRAAAAAAREA